MTQQLTCNGPIDENSEEYFHTRTIGIALLIFSLISVLSSFIVVFFYAAYLRMRKDFLSFLIFILAVLDIFCWLNIIITDAYYLDNKIGINCSSPGFCVFMAFMWSLCELLNFGVTLLISLSLYMALMKNIDPAIYKRKMLFLVFSISLILAIIPFGIPSDPQTRYDNELEHLSYGPVDKFKCWITNKWARIGLFYVPMWIIIAVNCAIMIIFIKGLHLGMFDELHDRYHTRFTMFPAIMMVCYLVSSIRRLIQVITGTEADDIFGLDLVMYLLMPLQGLLNTIVFGMFEEFIRVRIKAFLMCDWKRLKELNEQEEAAQLEQVEYLHNSN